MKRSDLQPHLVGDLIELRPMAAGDWADLFAVASDPLIWEGHPAQDRYKEEVFRQYFQEGMECGGSLVALDRKDGKIIGASRYVWSGPQQDELEIGWTFLARSFWGGVYNGEMKRLMLNHAFQFVDKVIFRVGTTNIRSQKAMTKIGAVLTDRRFKAEFHGRVVESMIFEIRRDPARESLARER